MALRRYRRRRARPAARCQRNVCSAATSPTPRAASISAGAAFAIRCSSATTIATGSTICFRRSGRRRGCASISPTMPASIGRNGPRSSTIAGRPSAPRRVHGISNATTRPRWRSANFSAAGQAARRSAPMAGCTGWRGACRMGSRPGSRRCWHVHRCGTRRSTCRRGGFRRNPGALLRRPAPLPGLFEMHLVTPFRGSRDRHLPTPGRGPLQRHPGRRRALPRRSPTI